MSNDTEGNLKAAMRKQLHARRDAMADEDRATASAAITEKVLRFPAYADSRVVMAYMTFGSEFLTAEFIRRVLSEHKTLVLPRMARGADGLVLHRVRDCATELLPGPWGILQPDPERCPHVEVHEIDFVLVPGLGFDPHCRRLGYGRGYYDRLLASRHPRTALVAAAYATQVVDEVPVGPHDVAVDVVVTERATHRRSLEE